MEVLLLFYGWEVGTRDQNLINTNPRNKPKMAIAHYGKIGSNVGAKSAKIRSFLSAFGVRGRRKSPRYSESLQAVCSWNMTMKSNPVVQVTVSLSN
jgi:hypothetical protein